MQKLITISLLALYVLASIGIHGVSHFCEDEFISVALFDDEDKMDCEDDACCNVPDNNPECCTDVQFALFLESEIAMVPIQDRSMKKAPIVPALPIFANSDQEYYIEKWKPDGADDPGDISLLPLYLRHQSLIFYG